jgi:hypothetical protein
MNQIQRDYDKASRNYDEVCDRVSFLEAPRVQDIAIAHNVLRCKREKLLAWALPIIHEREGFVPTHERDQVKAAMKSRLVATGTR